MFFRGELQSVIDGARGGWNIRRHASVLRKRKFELIAWNLCAREWAVRIADWPTIGSGEGIVDVGFQRRDLAWAVTVSLFSKNIIVIVAAEIEVSPLLSNIVSGNQHARSEERRVG